MPESLALLDAELREAMGAKKCWRCGCFQDTVNTLQESDSIKTSLHALLDDASKLFEPKRYDCMGCDVCWPAVAQNIAAELDPVIGRESEIERVIQILSRRTKNNPVLIGDPGVGKTAIVEGLAQKIAEKDRDQTSHRHA